MRATTVPTQRSRELPSNPLGYITAEAWIKSRNDMTEVAVKGFEWCRVGIRGRKHRLNLVTHVDGTVTAEPACRIGYYGQSAERVVPVSQYASGEFCNRVACVYDTPGRRAPSLSPHLHPRQLELDLIV